MITNKKLYSIILFSISVILFLILVSSTVSTVNAQNTSTTIAKTRITTSGLASNPAIYGNCIVWEDYRNGNADIYMYDLSTQKETQITTNESEQVCPDICGNRIVWTEYERGGNDDIHMYDLSTFTETQITTNNSTQNLPAIYGDKIAWQDRRNEDGDIYMYEISTSKEIRLTSGKSEQWGRPAIFGDRIVWTDSRNGYDIYMYNLSTSRETQITTNELGQEYPDIFEDRIVWVNWRSGNSDIYMYNLSTSKETRISTSGLAFNPAIYGNWIVWQDSRNGNRNIYYNNGNRDIYVYDLSTQKEIQITTSKSDQINPSIYGNRIVWEDYCNGNNSPDIYMCTLNSSPLTASFSTSSTYGNESLKVCFTDNTIGEPTTWEWNFGDGTNSTEQNPEHVYSTEGNYTVTLTTSNEYGTDTNVSEIKVQSASPTIPDGFNFFIFLSIVSCLFKRST